MNPADAGESWEREFISIAQDRGLKARKVSGNRPHDAVVNGLKVQCKNITYEKNGEIRIGKSYGKGGTRRYRRADFDILALNFRGELFFIPAQTLCGTTERWPNSIVVHRFRRYLENWEVFLRRGNCEEAVQQTLWE